MNSTLNRVSDAYNGLLVPIGTMSHNVVMWLSLSSMI